MRKACYIAGPMRGLPKYNYPAFMEAEDKLQKAGWLVYNPAQMDIEIDGEDYMSHTIQEQKLHDTAAVLRKFAKRDVRVLIERLEAELGDALITLPDWEKSVGATAEVAVAKWIHLRVLTLEEALNAPY